MEGVFLNLMMKKIAIVCVLLLSLVVLAVCLRMSFFTGDNKDYSNNLFKALVVNPIPNSVKNIQILHDNSPTFGSGSRIISFEIAPDDFETMLKMKSYNTGKISYLKPYIKNKIPNHTVYSYKWKTGPNGWEHVVEMLVNENKTKVFYYYE